MKTNHLQKLLLIMAANVLAGSGITGLAQDAPATNAVQPAAANASVPHLAYGVPQILQLARADVGDEIIIAYIKNSGNCYGLGADQISYLRQQGVSAPVISTMLNQPNPGVGEVAAAPPASSPSALINPVEPAGAVGVEPTTVGDSEPVAPVAAETTATVNNEPAPDANAEAAFIYYPDPLAPGGNPSTVTVIYYQSAPASPGGYQRQYPPILGGSSVIIPGIGFGRLAPAGWSGGFQNTRKFHRGWQR